MNYMYSWILITILTLSLWVPVSSVFAQAPPPPPPPPPSGGGGPTGPTSTGTCKNVPLPELPGIPDPCSSPAAYIQYWFYLGMYLGGIAALMAIVIAGAFRVFFAYSPAQTSKADHYITNAALGLILLFGSWLLLRALGGSDFTTVRDPVLPQLPPISAVAMNGKAGQACSTVSPAGPLPMPQASCASGLICGNDSVCKKSECYPNGQLINCTYITSPSTCTASVISDCCAWDGATCVYKNP